MRDAPEPEQILAIGLVWGHLSARQFDDALQLARACIQIWPDDRRFALMAAYAAVELAAELDDSMRAALELDGATALAGLIWRRAGAPSSLDTETAGDDE
jgi:hypothetical protein